MGSSFVKAADRGITLVVSGNGDDGDESLFGDSDSDDDTGDYREMPQLVSSSKEEGPPRANGGAFECPPPPTGYTLVNLAGNVVDTIESPHALRLGEVLLRFLDSNGLPFTGSKRAVFGQQVAVVDPKDSHVHVGRTEEVPLGGIITICTLVDAAACD